MLQIDENQLQVYSCSFSLYLGNASLPIKFKDARYYIEWKVKNKQSGNKSSQQVVNDLGYVQFEQKLKIHTQILRNIRTQKFLKKYSQLTLYLISSKAPERPKIVGSMLIELHQVLNSNKHGEMKWIRLNLSPFDVDLQLKCTAIECRASSILEANLDAALTVKESFITRSGLGTGMRHESDYPVFLKKKITKQLQQQDDHLSKGDCSILRPELEEVLEIHQSPIQSPSSLLINSASIIQEVNFETVNKLEQMHQKKITAIQLGDVQHLLKENSHLKRLLIVSKAERRIEVERYELELREMARQLSLKEAELLKLAETEQSGSMKVGQLLDSAAYTLDNFNTLKNQNKVLAEQLSIQRQYNTQLDQNYKRLEVRLQMVKDWQHQRAFLIDKISQIEEENQHYQLKYFDLQNKKSIHQEQLLKTVNQITARIQQLQDQIKRRDKIIELYQDKVKQFEEEISFIQEEVVHRVQYSATSQANSTHEQSWAPKQRNRGKVDRLLDNDHIKIQEDGLKGIQQQSLEESYISATAQKQIATAAELPTDHFNESDFYRKMASNVQHQLDQLHLLYRQKDRVLINERATSKSLYEELQRLRFQFVYELSKVTSQLNNKVLEIRQLKQENTFLRQRDIQLYATKIQQLEADLNELEQQRLQYFDRCYRLQEENLNLINFSKEKEEIYLSIIKNGNCAQSQDEDFISAHFSKLLGFMAKNEGKYSSILNKCHLVLLQAFQKCSIQGGNCSPYQFQSSVQSFVSQSNIFQRVIQEKNLPDSAKNSSSSFQQELLIQSTAQHISENQVTSSGTNNPNSLIKQMLSDLSDLKTERENGISLLRQLATKSDLSFKKSEKISPLIQLLKKTILFACQQPTRCELIRIVKNIQFKLSLFLQLE